MSREIFRISGKKLPVPAAAEGWTFETRPGGWVIATGKNAAGASIRRRFFLHEAKGKLSFSMGGSLFFGPIDATARGGATAGGSDLDLIAQFPGKVRKVLVQEGATVAEGEPMLLLEAMKMEFSVKAPFAGKITKIRVTEGQQLSPGDRFLDLVATS